jgi:hypothetical protein
LKLLIGGRKGRFPRGVMKQIDPEFGLGPIRGWDEIISGMKANETVTKYAQRIKSGHKAAEGAERWAEQVRWKNDRRRQVLGAGW